MSKLSFSKIGAAVTTGLLMAPAAFAQVVNPNDPYGMNAVEGLNVSRGDLRTTVVNIINIALSLLGLVAVCIILFGGFKWMTSGGEEGKVKEAKQLMIQGVIGLVIIFSAWAIASFVLSSLQSASQAA